jgi:Bacterial regulatory protein, arsR family
MAPLARQSDDDASKDKNGPSDSAPPSRGSADCEANVHDLPSKPANPLRATDTEIDLNSSERDILFAMTRLRAQTFDQIATKTGISVPAVQHGLTHLLDMDLIEQRKVEVFAAIYDISPRGLAWVRSKGYRD